MTSESAEIVEFVKAQAGSDTYGAYCRNLLAELVEIDTSPTCDLTRLRENESKTLALIEDAVREVLGDRAEIERRPIAPEIEAIGEYSTPYYAASDSNGPPRPAADVYGGRCNLVVRIVGGDGSGAVRSDVYNTHIDTVGPWFKPWTDADRVYGRGACDAKGSIAALLGQIRLCEAVRERWGVAAPHDRVYQFTIDQESGGNGTLSLCHDALPAEAAAVCYAMTGNVAHPANRGAVWFACRLDGDGTPGASTLQMFPFVLQAVEQAGRKLAEASSHALFEPAHVQTNFGVLGAYGTHPSAVPDHVALLITVQAKANPQRVMMHLIELLDAAMADYCACFGDLTRQTDPITGKPRLAAHYKLSEEPQPDRLGFRLDIYGKAGHMGALAECDNALSKVACLLIAMLRFARNFPNVEGEARLVDGAAGPLVLEGAQGFLPTHSLGDVEERIAAAAVEGVKSYCDFAGIPFAKNMVRTSFDKLRNDAYASEVDCPPMQAFRAAFGALGRPWPEPKGWPVRCDARLFGQRGVPTVTFGPGRVLQAHSREEQIAIREIQDAVAIGTLATMYLGGALGPPSA